MAKTAALILSYFLAHGAPGGSVYSFAGAPECGHDASAPACSLERSCEAAGPLCAAPRWSSVRGAWVRVETRDQASDRWTGIAASLERVAGRLVDCRLPDGSVDLDCEPAGWPRGTGRARELAFAGATVAFWESGLREDIEIGAPPMGRGPAGEVCLAQVMPDQIQSNASWLNKADRTRALSRDEREQLARTLLGTSPEALDRCFEVSMRILARARRSCAGKGLAWTYSTFAAYGTGSSCTSSGIAGDFAQKRQRTLSTLIASAQAPATIAKR